MLYRKDKGISPGGFMRIVTNYIIFVLTVIASVFLYVNKNYLEASLVMVFAVIIFGLIFVIKYLEKRKMALKDIYTNVFNENGFFLEFQRYKKQYLNDKIVDLYVVKVVTETHKNEFNKAFGQLLNERFSFDVKAYFGNDIFGIMFINLNEVIVKEMANQIESWIKELNDRLGIEVTYKISYFQVLKDLDFEEVMLKIKGA